MQIVSGVVVLGVNNSRPSCFLSAERQKRLHLMSSSSRSLRQGWGGVYESRKRATSVMSGLFLHSHITPSSPNCTNMYAAVDIISSA